MNKIVIEGERKTKLCFDLNLLNKELNLKVDCNDLNSYEITNFCLYVLNYFEKLTETKNGIKSKKNH